MGLLTTRSPPVTQGDSSQGDSNTSQHLRRRALGGLVWMSAVNVVRGVVRIAVLAILGRLLLPADFGLVAAAGAVLWFCNLFSSLGVGPALVQRSELEPRHVHTSFAFSLALGVVLAVVAFVTAPLVAQLFRIPTLVPVLRVMAFVLPVAALSVTGESLLQRELQFGAIARFDLASYVIGYGVIGVGLAWLGAGVWALVGAEIAKTVIKSALFLVATPYSKRLGFDARALRELVRFGSGYTATALSMYVALQGDNLVIARALGPVALGLYGRAYELMLVPAKALGEVLDKVLFATLSKVQNDRRQLAIAYRRGMALVALLVLPVSVATVVLAPEIVLALLGPKWSGAILPLRILTTAMYFQIGYMVGQSVANASGAVYHTAWRSAVYAILVVVGAMAGRSWGIAGVAAGVALAIAANFVMISQLCIRITGLPLRLFFSLHAPAISLAGTSGLVLWVSTAALRHAALPAIVTLVVAAVVAAAWVLIVLRLFPTQTLGVDGMWMMTTVYRSTPAPLRPLLNWAMIPQPIE